VGDRFRVEVLKEGLSPAKSAPLTAERGPPLTVSDMTLNRDGGAGGGKVDDPSGPPEDPEKLFEQARKLDGEKKTAEADAILAKLAPTDGTGYGPAHLAVARRLLSSTKGRWPDRDVVNAAQAHLQKATQWTKDKWVAPDAHLELAQIYKVR